MQPRKADPFLSPYEQNATEPMRSLKLAVYAGERANGEKNRKVLDRLIEISKRASNSLEKSYIRLDSNTNVQQLAVRVQASRFSDYHLNWLYNFSLKVAKGDTNAICTQVLPILATDARSKETRRRASAEKGLINAIDQLFPKVLQEESTVDCAYTMLEMEISLLKNNPVELSKRWETRKDWKLTTRIAEYFWQVSEVLDSSGMRKEAATIWQYLADKADPGSPVKQFAKVRLDGTRTESDKFWH